MQEVVQYMQESWDSIVDYADFEFSFLQQDLEAAYRDELRWRRLITWAAVGAVFISALGAFALTALAAGRRTKEIGIRKALRCQRLRPHHADHPRVCLSRPDWLGGGVASVLVVDARLAEWLCLPH